MDDLRFYVLFNSILVVSSCWNGDNERWYAMEPDFHSERCLPQAGIEPGTVK